MNYGIKTIDGKNFIKTKNTDTIANPTYINVEDFGVSVSNTGAQNLQPLTDAINSMKINGHGLQFGLGTYLIDGELPKIEHGEYCLIKGVTSQQGANPSFDITTIRRSTGSSFPILRIEGEEWNGGTGIMQTGTILENILFHGGGTGEDVVQLIACAEARIVNCMFRSCGGDNSALRMVQFMDSVIDDCRFEWSGGATTGAVHLQSGVFEGKTYEYTNTISFINCSWESNYGVGLKSEGIDTNVIKIYGCKFEQPKDDYRSIELSNCRNVMITDTEVQSRGITATDLASFIRFENVDMLTCSMMVESYVTMPNTYQSFIEVVNCDGVNMILQGDVNRANAITGEYIVNVSNSDILDINFLANGVLAKAVWNGFGQVKKIKHQKVIQSSTGTVENEVIIEDAVNPTLYRTQYIPSGNEGVYKFQREFNGVSKTIYEINTADRFVMRNEFALNDNEGAMFLANYSANPSFLGSNPTGLLYVDSVNDTWRATFGGALKRIGYKSAFPTTGTWNTGDIIYNTTPTAGGKLGWVCTAGGTSGTWKAFGLIDA